MVFQRIGSGGIKSTQTAAPVSPFAPRPFAAPRTPGLPTASADEGRLNEEEVAEPRPDPRHAFRPGQPGFTIYPPAAAAPGRVQRLPSNNNDPTGQANGTYWDRQTASPTRPEGVMGRVTAIMKDPADGGAPSVSPPGWVWLQNKIGKLKGQWVRFHIINQYLGGPGNSAWNLVPTSVAVNNAFHNGIERNAKNSASTLHNWTYVDVSLAYNAAWPAPIPTAINAEWGNWDGVGGQWVARGVLPAALGNPDITALGAGFNYLRGVGITQAQVRARGVPARHLRAFTTWLQNYRQADDDDMDLMNAAEAQFGEDFDVGWLDQVWLDEDDTTPGSYMPVIKAI